VITELDTSSILGIPCCSATLCDAALEKACSMDAESVCAASAKGR
jgi:hypothetical protein